MRVKAVSGKARANSRPGRIIFGGFLIHMHGESCFARRQKAFDGLCCKEFIVRFFVVACPNDDNAHGFVAAHNERLKHFS